MRLIVGLGNPGARYEGSRHNVGAEVVERLCRVYDVSLKRARRPIRADVAEFHVDSMRVAAGVPRTYMNESGQAVAPLARYYRVPPEDLLVIHDDIDLPFSKMRVQLGRGAGGNHGVASIIRSFHTPDFWRLKVGVGRPPGRMDPADFVLERFTTVERSEMDVTVARAVDVVETFIVEGGDAARQRAGAPNAS
jgi:PTH1 family peptidyl-tRNA hydrolase